MTTTPSNAKITLPNAITLFRLVGAPIFFLLLYSGGHAAFYLYVLLVVSDFLDGLIARWQHSVSLWGERWDPIADKLLIIPTLLYFWSIGVADLVPVFAICVRELIVIYFRGVAQGKHIRTPSMMVGKLKMVFESIALGLLILGMHAIGNTTLWVAMTFALASLIQYARHWPFVQDVFSENKIAHKVCARVIRK
ncbi:MAG TPA: CDP-alcohol phosphatidyltransferase family protein [Patescibacteria group bacterium]|nr:CDP-alcohol phosphatidyltransferase family protein [Patescibacteria group bacterium]